MSSQPAPSRALPSAGPAMSVRAVALGGLALVLAQVALFLILAGGDVSRLVHAAPPLTDPAAAPQSLTVGPAGTGFDGQMYYRQAEAPVSTAPSVNGVMLDLPAVRSARVGYPLLAAALSLGQKALLPWALLGVNVLAAVALVAAVAAIAVDAGRSPAWGLVAVSFPGFVYTLGFDLAELTAVALLALGMLAARRSRWLLTAALWSAALLTRESAAVLPLAAATVVALDAARRRRVDRGMALAAGVPLLVLLVWQLSLKQVFGGLPVLSSGEKNIGLPLQGLLDSAGQFAPTSTDGVFRLVSLGGLLALLGIALACARSSAASRVEKAALVLAAVVLSTLSPFVWAGATSFMRAAAEMGLLATVVAATSTARTRLLLPLVVAPVTLLTLASQVIKA